MGGSLTYLLNAAILVFSVWASDSLADWVVRQNKHPLNDTTITTASVRGTVATLREEAERPILEILCWDGKIEALLYIAAPAQESTAFARQVLVRSRIDQGAPD
jgi:hypothetical protein